MPGKPYKNVRNVSKLNIFDISETENILPTLNLVEAVGHRRGQLLPRLRAPGKDHREEAGMKKDGRKLREGDWIFILSVFFFVIHV